MCVLVCVCLCVCTHSCNFCKFWLTSNLERIATHKLYKNTELPSSLSNEWCKQVAHRSSGGRQSKEDRQREGEVILCHEASTLWNHSLIVRGLSVEFSREQILHEQIVTLSAWNDCDLNFLCKPTVVGKQPTSGLH